MDNRDGKEGNSEESPLVGDVTGEKETRGVYEKRGVWVLDFWVVFGKESLKRT